MKHPKAAIAQRAIELCEPSIRKMTVEGAVKRAHFFIVIAIRDNSLSTRHEIIAEEAWGNMDRWDENFVAIALQKTRHSARAGRPSRIERLDLPKKEDGLYWGSIVQSDIIISCAGAGSNFDEVICKLTAAVYQGLINKEAGKPKTGAGSDISQS